MIYFSNQYYPCTMVHKYFNLAKSQADKHVKEEGSFGQWNSKNNQRSNLCYFKILTIHKLNPPS